MSHHKTVNIKCDWCGATESVQSEQAQPAGWAQLSCEMWNGQHKQSVEAGFGTSSDICLGCVAAVREVIKKRSSR